MVEVKGKLMKVTSLILLLLSPLTLTFMPLSPPRMCVSSSVCNAQCGAYPWMTLSDKEVCGTSGVKVSFKNYNPKSNSFPNYK